MEDGTRPRLEAVQRAPLSRRRLLRTMAGAAVSVSLMGLLAACGSDEDDDPTSTPDQETGTTEPTTDAEASPISGSSGASSDSFPVTFEHKYGSTTIDSIPQRVVTAGFNEGDFALALGVTPVGVREWLGDYPFQSRPWAQDQLAGTQPETVGGLELDFERVAALQPDLILGLYAGLTEDEYAKFEAIAPTVIQPADVPDLGISWQQQMILTGRALGQESRAEEIVAGVETQYEEARAAHQEFEGLTAVFASFDNEGFWIFEADDIRTQFLTSLGFELPAETGQFSHEQAQALDHDAVVAVINRETLESDPLYGNLDAVREDRVIYLDNWSHDLAAAIGFNSPLSHTYLIDEIVPMLAAAVGGESEAGPTTSAGSFPVTIEHKFGSTTIEAAPTRVVLVGLVEQDALLALGTVPVATREWYGERPGAIFEWAEDELGDAEPPEVLDAAELDFERIAAMDPDIIVGLYSGTTQEEYDTLSRIAPTVAQPAEYVDWGIPWQELTVKIGQIMGKQAEAEDLVAGIEQQFAAAVEAHPEFEGAAGAVASPFGLPENYYVYSSQDVRGRIMSSLGFQVPEVFDELAGAEFGATLSVEQLELVADLDVLIWVANEDSLADLDLYQSLPVVQEGRDLYYGDGNPVYDALNFGTVLSLPFAVERLVPDLAAAIDGDPATEASS